MFEEESPTGMSEDTDIVNAVGADSPQDNLASEATPAASADEAQTPANVAETAEPVAQTAQFEAIPSSDTVPVETNEPAIEVVPEPEPEVVSEAPQATDGDAGDSDADADIESDDFIKDKVSKAKAAKKKASATAARARATRKAKEKLPDLGDGSGYEPPDPPLPMADGSVNPEVQDDALWYAVHCYSGYENKVKHSLEQRIETMGMAGRIIEIVVPTEEEIEVRDGKRKTVERRVFPGYVIVRMRMSEDSWFVVRNTPGVTRFIGMGNRPQPLSPQEVNQILKRMEAEAPKIRVSFKTGQKVRITDGPFADLMGLVDRIDTEHAKVVVLVNFFGRDTPVELDFLQVEKM